MIKITNKNARIVSFSVFVFVLVCLILLSFSIKSINAANSGSNGSANLSIYDDMDLGPLTKYTNSNISFYGNYTNSSDYSINQSNGNGNCTIMYNFSGVFTSPSDMIFNGSSYLWKNNKTFNYKGEHTFVINCTSSYGNISLNDTFFVSNTQPTILKDNGGYINLDNNGETTDYWLCNEDTLCVYNFSANVSDPDVNDVLTYNYTQSANTTLTNFTLNLSMGVLTINVTDNQNSGGKRIELSVTDTGDLGVPSSLVTAVLLLNITAVNDRPQFVNLQNQTLNATQLFDYVINITDEESNTPYSFNITFLNCSVAQWSDRNCSIPANKMLFNSSQYNSNGTALNISFTPGRNDVGNYTINFTVKDLNNVNNPKNASTSQIITFEVSNVNSAPYFNYRCDNERNGTENGLFNCYINASDIDEIYNLTIFANETWFKFNNSGVNNMTLPVNISTNFNASFLVNFTPADGQVGNWSIVLTLTDTALPIQTNATTIVFYFSNVNDSVTLQQIDNITVYSNFNSTIYVNATDDDLLIIDKRAYNENMTFSSNTSWVNITSTSVVSGTNIISARMDIYPNSSFSGINYVNISVRDANNYSVDSRIFAINVSVNSPPEWNSNVQRQFYLNESINFYLNLSTNVSDAQGDAINFTFSISDQYPFPLFDINKTTGVINFTPEDLDVGFHTVIINATDSKGSPSSLTFNFTVYNLNDNVSIKRPIVQGDVTNATVIGLNSNINASEDNFTLINIYVYDDDFLINQTSYYSENLTFNVSVRGPNVNLLNYGFIARVGPNASRYDINFTANHSDIGNYNVTINVTDSSNSSDYLTFNLTIYAVSHPPSLSDVPNQNISIFESFFYDANATDVEDVNEGAAGSNLTYSVLNLSANGNFLNLTNASNGIITNITNLTGRGGIWNFSVRVSDSSGLIASKNFTLRIYGYPSVILPDSSYVFNMQENVTSSLNFSANHSVGDSLTYKLYINNVLRNQTSANGNGTAFLWNFTANFSDETTCAGSVNLTINVSNQKLSNSTSWAININHTNYPLTFSGTIGDGTPPTLSVTNSQAYSLNNYFTDIDATDSCNNQTIGFMVQRFTDDTITASIINWTYGVTPSITFSSSTGQSGNYSITAFEYNTSLYNSSILRNVSSNNFSVSVTIVTVTVPTSGGGGGGSGATPNTPTPKTIVLKIVLPDPISVDKRDKIILPVKLMNNGQEVLNGINLTSIISLNGIIAQGMVAYFDRNFIDSLKAGQEQNVTLTVEVDAEREGMYEITINATVENPKFNDWGKIYLNVKEGANIERKILFVDQLIVDNPECIEIKELVEYARRLYANKDFKSAEEKIDEAVNACKRSIEQVTAFNKVAGVIKGSKTLTFVLLTTILTLASGIVYYLYNRMVLRRKFM